MQEAAGNTGGSGSIFSRPQQLIYTDRNCRLNVYDEVLQQVASLSDKKLVVVAVTGLTKTGKSYLLNRLAGGNTGFAIDLTITPKTKGIWIWVKDHPQHTDRYLVLLDTEGFGNVDEDNPTQDGWIFSLAMLLSSVLVYSVFGVIDEAALSGLHAVLGQLQHLITLRDETDNANDAAYDRYVPQLVLALRDFNLDLETDGKEMSSDEYMERCLSLKSGCSIRKYFKKRKCFTMDRPCSKKEWMNLESMPDSDLSIDFVNDSSLFSDYVYKNGVIKDMHGSISFSGRMWSCLVRSYINSIQNGTGFCIETAFLSVAKEENDHVCRKGLEMYQSRLARVLLPTPDEGTLSSAHSEAMTDALKWFRDHSIPETDDAALGTLKENIKEEYEKADDNNRNKSSSACQSRLALLENKFEISLKNGGYVKVGGYKQYLLDLDDLENAYFEDKTIGLMAVETWIKYRNENKFRGDLIQSAERQISALKAEYDRMIEADPKQPGTADSHTLKIMEKRMADLESVMKKNNDELLDKLLQDKKVTEHEIGSVHKRHGAIVSAGTDESVSTESTRIKWAVHTLRPVKDRTAKLVKPSTQDFSDRMTSDKVKKNYHMNNASKGQACVISIANFQPESLITLDGYNRDRSNLADMWTMIGFNTWLPENADGQYDLTAQELKNAVKEFAEKLQAADQCCVLCIMTHGGDGYLYGTDGMRVRVGDIISHFNNKNCPVMRDKPKVIMLQACAGGIRDRGIAAHPSPVARAAAGHTYLPEMSDTVICLPTLQGMASYVYDIPDRGSVYIESLIDVFTEFACDTELLHLMTLVNDRVASKRTRVEGDDPGDYMQMSNQKTCLRRFLYFLPCDNGMDGEDWNPSG